MDLYLSAPVPTSNCGINCGNGRLPHCNKRRSIGNGSHTLDRMYTYPSYDRLLSTIGLSLDSCDWGAYEWVWISLHANSGPERTSQTILEELMTRANIYENLLCVIWESNNSFTWKWSSMIQRPRRSCAPDLKDPNTVQWYDYVA